MTDGTTRVEDKAALRRRIARDVRAFTAKGGSIERVEPGQTAIDPKTNKPRKGDTRWSIRLRRSP